MVDKCVQKMMSSDYIIASDATFSPGQGFKFHEDGLNEDIISTFEQKPEIENGGKLYKNTLGNGNITVDYGQEITEKNDAVIEDGITLTYGTIAGREYPIVLGNDGTNIYVSEAIGFIKAKFIRLN